jgi:hypothetical protein
MKKAKETITVTEKVFTVLGFTEEVQSCECCGRTDLKGTVALERNDGEGIVYYGVVCAAKAQGYTKKYTEDLVKASIKEAQAKAAAEIRANPVYAEYEAFMAATDKELEDIAQKNLPYEIHSAVVKRRIAMGDKLRAVKEEVRKKYLLKYL